MDELYTTTLGNVTKIAYEETNNDGTDVDNHRKYYREFDYGIDTENNIIFIQDEIQSGLTFDIVSKVRLLKKINGSIIYFLLYKNLKNKHIEIYYKIII